MAFRRPICRSGQRARMSFERVVQEGSDPLSMQKKAERILLSRYVPPSVVIDDDLQVLHFRGDLGPYLGPTPGAATLDLLKLVRDTLTIDLREAIDAAKQRNVPIRKEGLRYRVDDRLWSIAIDVVPVHGEQGSKRHFVVLFQRLLPDLSQPTVKEGSNGDGAPPEHFERENAALREQLQSVIEQNEAASEELKAANEEILSSNEELQSTNEELQTSKEEMQSTNEELSTVNDELKHRNRELGRLNDDLINLLGGLNIPIIMVSRELKIRRFTPPAEELFNVIPSDLGRPLGDLRPNLKIPDLLEQINVVIKDLVPREFEVQDHSGQWYSLRIRPYITADNKIDGAAIAAVDIDELRRNTEQLKASRDYADAIVETVWEPLLVLDDHLRINRANSAFSRMFAVEPASLAGQVLWDICDGQWNQPALRAPLEKILPEHQRLSDLELTIDCPGLGPRTLLINAHRIFWEGNETQMVLLAMEDITAHKRDLEQAKLLAKEQAGRLLAEAASRSKDEFLAMLAHELRNPLAPIRSALDLLATNLPTIRGRAGAARLERQIVHITRILDDLLDVSRITRGKIDLRKELVDLADVIGRGVETSRR